MSNGTSMDYKFGPKNQWRRTIHNRILERLAVHPRDAVALYLAGPQDLDRAEFLRRGYNSNNLIAVDRDHRIIQDLRTQKKLALGAPLGEICKCWQGLNVHVVFADLCCGLTAETTTMLAATALNPYLSKAVIAVNLLRGRDSFSNTLRQALKIKHRGRAAMADVTLSVRVAFGDMLWEKLSGHWAQFWKGVALSGWRDSYKSTSGQIFDSAVWRGMNLVEFTGYIGLGGLGIAENLHCKSDSSVVARVAAIKAVRTQRANQ